jgi:hypothetical protein
MQSADHYLEILRERGRKGLPLERVYRQLFNRDLYLKAYGHIYRNQGAMTHGITDETADGMSLEKIDAIIEALRHERYRWKPARRVWIPKKNGKKRPLGVTSWSDKLVAEVICMILNAYYDSQFSDHSHGFRENRGCGTKPGQPHKRHYVSRRAKIRGHSWTVSVRIVCFLRKDRHRTVLSELRPQKSIAIDTPLAR